MERTAQTQQFHAQLLKQFTSKAVYYYFFPPAQYLEISIAEWMVGFFWLFFCLFWFCCCCLVLFTCLLQNITVFSTIKEKEPKSKDIETRKKHTWEDNFPDSLPSCEQRNIQLDSNAQSQLRTADIQKRICSWKLIPS